MFIGKHEILKKRKVLACLSKPQLLWYSRTSIRKYLNIWIFSSLFSIALPFFLLFRFPLSPKLSTIFFFQITAKSVVLDRINKHRFFLRIWVRDFLPYFCCFFSSLHSLSFFCLFWFIYFCSLFFLLEASLTVAIRQVSVSEELSQDSQW